MNGNPEQEESTELGPVEDTTVDEEKDMSVKTAIPTEHVEQTQTEDDTDPTPHTEEQTPVEIKKSHQAEDKKAAPAVPKPKPKTKVAAPVPKMVASKERSMVNPREDQKSMKPGTAEIGFPPEGPEGEGTMAQALQREHTRTKLPPQVIKMSTVSMASKAKPRTPSPSRILHSRSNHNYIESRNTKKVLTWDEATNSRPPLRIDMEGPTPWSYSPQNKPLHETNAPSWSFGRKTYVEKAGGSRTSWEKTWFQSGHIWHQKADFHSERTWPSPPSYTQPPSLGPRQVTNTAFPAFSIGIRRIEGLNKKGSSDEPSPNDYESWRSDGVLAKRAPSFTHGLRRGGTVLWPSSEGYNTPGPGAYMPDLRSSRHHKPAYTIRGIRRDKVHELGPFATF